MLSKSTLKYLRSLQQKKYRKQYGAFMVEGAKSVLELANSRYKIDKIFLTEKFAQQYQANLTQKADFITVTEKELQAAGTFKTNDAALAVAFMQPNTLSDISGDAITLVLDDIRDPGNLGAILRVADWYGVKQVVCSESCADFYNPKVIAASMGSFTRVQAWYGSLPAFFEKLPAAVKVYGTFPEGDNLYTTCVEKGACIVIGNESKGISAEVQPYVHQRIAIPRFGGAESLNAAIATAVVCDNFRRCAGD